MFRELPTLARLLQHLHKIPYLASKNVYRIAEHFLRLKPEQVDQLCAILSEVKQNITVCDTCFSWKELSQGCMFCLSQTRDHSTVCVVETWQELLSLEKTNGYKGVYHVLGGVISPLEGIGPQDLRIIDLMGRIDHGGIIEVILAMNQTPEGEATIAYIGQKLADKPVKISRLARGMPVGSSLDAMDRVTVYKALAERRPF